MRQVAGKYLVGGITLISEIALPELPLIQQQDATLHPVTIRLGEVPCQLPHREQPLRRPFPNVLVCQSLKRELHLEVPLLQKPHIDLNHL